MRKFFAQLAAFMGFSTTKVIDPIYTYVNQLSVINRELNDLQTRVDSGSPIFYPKKHTKQSYRSQQRAARKRRRARA